MSSPLEHVIQALNPNGMGQEFVTDHEQQLIKAAYPLAHVASEVISSLMSVDDYVALDEGEIKRIEKLAGRTFLKQLAEQAPLLARYRIFAPDSEYNIAPNQKASELLHLLYRKGVTITYTDIEQEPLRSELLSTMRPEVVTAIEEGKIFSDSSDQKPFVTLSANQAFRFLELLANETGRELLKTLANVYPPSASRLTDMLFLLSRISIENSISLAKMFPVLEFYSDPLGQDYFLLHDPDYRQGNFLMPSFFHDKKIDEILEIPEEERIRFNQQLRENYSPLFHGKGILAAYWLKLYEQRAWLFDPQFVEFFKVFATKFVLDEKQTMALLISCAYQPFDLPQGQWSNQANDVLEWVASKGIPFVEVEHAYSYLGGMIHMPEELFPLLEWIYNPNPSNPESPHDSHGVTQFFQEVRNLRQSPSLIESLEHDPGFFDRLNEARDLGLMDIDRFRPLLYLARWPEGISLTETLQLLLSYVKPLGPLSLYCAKLSWDEPVRQLLASSDFRDWFDSLAEHFPNGLIYPHLENLVTIYQMGPQARAKLLDPTFIEQCKQFHKKGVYSYREGENLSTKIVLLLLHHPADVDWSELEGFSVQNNYDGTLTEELYINYLWIQQNPNVQAEYNRIVTNPAYGRDVIYKRVPLFRSDSNGYYDERPEWEQLPPYLRLRALIFTRNLDDPNFVQELGRSLLEDIADKGQEHRMTLNPQDDNSFTLDLAKSDGIPMHNGTVITISGSNDFLNLFSAHQHALSLDNAKESGPSSDGKIMLLSDMGVVYRSNNSQLVISTVGTAIEEGKEVLRFNVDFYGFAPGMKDDVFVLDLGIYRVPLDEIQ